MASLTLQTPLTLVAGKGGVGKTTLAAALAVAASSARRPLLVVSTDPAHSLADVLRQPLAAGIITAVAPNLWALQIDPRQTFKAFSDRVRSLLAAALDRGTYLDQEDIERLIDMPLPGIDEVTALLELVRLVPDPRWAALVLDTAPTGHTERLLRLPRAFAAFGDLLDMLQERHRFMVARLQRGVPRPYVEDPVDRFIAQLRDDADHLNQILHDPQQTRVVVVTTQQWVVLAETTRYLRWLQDDQLPLSGVIVNHVDRCYGSGSGVSLEEIIAELRAYVAEVAIFAVPRLRVPPTGPRRLWRFARLVRPVEAWTAGNARAPGDADPPWSGTPTRFPLSTLPLQLVVGKGGVGKTTIASANAAALAQHNASVLLVSLDPAHSLGDVWGRPIGDRFVAVANGVDVIEVDAPARWERLREGWHRAVVSAGEDEEHAAIPGWSETLADVDHLLAIIPPGVDEIVGLFALAELWEQHRYSHIVVDCAPTGHLLRLLELPGLALRWIRLLMGLLLKYRNVVGLGELAEELVVLSRRLKRVEALLRDPANTCFLPVTTSDALVNAETERLLAALQDAGMPVGAIVWNSWNTGSPGRRSTRANVSPGPPPVAGNYPLVEVGFLRIPFPAGEPTA